MDKIEEYLKPTSIIDSDSQPLRQKATELTSGESDPVEKAKRLFYFVRDQIKYTMYVDIEHAENYRASHILQVGEGYCVMKAVLLVALARAAGIPARLAFADLINYMIPRKYIEMQGNNRVIYHGFAEIHLNGKWVKLTPSFDIDMCRKYGILPTDFDGETDALLQPVDQRGNRHIEYIEFHGSYQDLPHQEIIEATTRGYKPGFLDTWREHARQEQGIKPPSKPEEYWGSSK